MQLVKYAAALFSIVSLGLIAFVLQFRIIKMIELSQVFNLLLSLPSVFCRLGPEAV